MIMIGDSFDRNIVSLTRLISLPHPPELNFPVSNWFLTGLAVKKDVPFLLSRKPMTHVFTAR